MTVEIKLTQGIYWVWHTEKISFSYPICSEDNISLKWEVIFR